MAGSWFDYTINGLIVGNIYKAIAFAVARLSAGIGGGIAARGLARTFQHGRVFANLRGAYLGSEEKISS